MLFCCNIIHIVQQSRWTQPRRRQMEEQLTQIEVLEDMEIHSHDNPLNYLW